jgi:signal peptidase II
MKEKLKFYKLFWAVSLCVLIADQLAKYFIQLAERASADGILFTFGSWFSLVYVKNTGAAWGMMAGSGYILGALAIVALVAVYLLRKALQIKRAPMQIAFGLLTAGIAGNMIDRLVLGYVVDFVDLNFGSYHFPAFNIADMGITIGVVIYIIFSSFEGMKEGKKQMEPTRG